MWPAWGFCPCTGPTEIQVARWFLKDKPVGGPRGAPGSTQLSLMSCQPRYARGGCGVAVLGPPPKGYLNSATEKGQSSFGTPRSTESIL